MAKPSGISGCCRVQVDSDGRVYGTFEQVPFASEKAELEAQMVSRFILSMNKGLASTGETFILANPKQNDENHFDFTVDSPRGPSYLELMEIAPLRGPYEMVPSNYKPYDFARVILEGVRSKSGRYGTSHNRDLFLLLYVTHWAFALSDTTLACLRYWCARQQLGFRAIFSYQPLDEDEGVPGWIYPYPPDLLGSFDPETVRDNVCINLDPRKFEVVRGRRP